MDYFVHDTDEGDGMVVNTPSPVDAAQQFINITRRTQPSRDVDPYRLVVYPLNSRNRNITPINPEDA